MNIITREMTVFFEFGYYVYIKLYELHRFDSNISFKINSLSIVDEHEELCLSRLNFSHIPTWSTRAWWWREKWLYNDPRNACAGLLTKNAMCKEVDRPILFIQLSCCYIMTRPSITHSRPCDHHFWASYQAFRV